MPISHLPHLADIDAATWDALVPDDQPFLCHAFLRSLEDSGSVSPRTGWTPAHALLRDAAGRAPTPSFDGIH